jgi:hypothetical protein
MVGFWASNDRGREKRRRKQEPEPSLPGSEEARENGACAAKADRRNEIHPEIYYNV